ncbi:hypothetical protein LV457_09765 [Mycobacterium sp. MYCO198283]|uniref:hypothetical protein n=1 Tax=Mycobacterium sp. MYCO198283 TaxID=2883505 RepID=UPI001E3F555C|nr:hypothetical protein [Mycobacterium sp. MYCO198283]MCG5432572.1 hypothetical protein [Mycobacterium sp. MYCO198283]
MDEDFRLPDGRKVRLTPSALENSEDHDDCPFCLGRAAAHRGDGEDCNPFPECDFPKGSPERDQDDHWLWAVGHALGSEEPGGLLWFEQSNRGHDA